MYRHLRRFEFTDGVAQRGDHCLTSPDVHGPIAGSSRSQRSDFRESGIAVINPWDSET